MKTQIIALGGGGFSCGTEPGLDRYLLAQTGVEYPRIGFVPTASAEDPAYIIKFYQRFSTLSCQPSHLRFFDRTPDLLAWALAQDVIFVGGGNTKSMLAVWQAWGFDEILRQAMQQGVLLAGISAGAICWFESGVTDSNAGQLGPIDALGFLPGSCCPHYSDDAERKPAFERMLMQGDISEGIAIDDGVAVHFVDGKLTRIVQGKTGVSAYRVQKTADAVLTSAIPDVEILQVYE
ncbi:Type 1 glutamine amidotransferase-like domain-containing protein [Undibacterium sp. Ren11W]|uniref:Type 1 glutamine amidotransferase-like domain-containing protein n=1 Tax=Undibacterium sp. Ren11W TaxID=3413045 RepID=UPI003BF2DB5C